MTIEKAIAELLISERFLEDSRKDAKLRVALGRHKRNTLKNGAAIELLEKYGYAIDVKKRRKG
jgi:hypothetical protein